MPEAAGDVLAVDDDEVGCVALAQPGQQRRAACGGRGRRRRRRRRGCVAGASGTAHTLAAWRSARANATADATTRRAAGRPSRRARPTPPPAPRRAGRRPALDPARRCCRSRCSALYAVARAAGPVLLLFIIAGGHRADPQPARRARCSARAAARAALAIVVVYLGFFASLVGVGVAARQPDRRPGLDVPATTCRRSSTPANDALADVQDCFDRKGINVQVKKQGQTALETLQDKVVGGTGDVVSFGARPAHAARRRPASG